MAPQQERSMIELSSQIAAYKEKQPMLEMDHFGEWVVFYNEELIGTYESDQDALNDAICKFGRGPYLVRQVGAPPIPQLASLIYR